MLGESNGRIKLVSKSNITGILPKGSFLTVESPQSKIVLRVDDSQQEEPYAPSPMIVDMNLQALQQDQKCQNIIYAYRVFDISVRNDGLIDYVRPQAIARKSTQKEIDLALGAEKKGPKIFLATVHANRNQLLTDDASKPITAAIPEDVFFHQTLICGKTGSGKTVAAKYLAQYFAEELGESAAEKGCVLMVNVKEADFLTMDKASIAPTKEVEREWNALNEKGHGVDNFMIYYPANKKLSSVKSINTRLAQKVTLNVSEIDPDALVGLLQNISDVAAQNLPDIFRYWLEEAKKKGETTFNNFISYMREMYEEREFDILNSRGDKSSITLPRGSYDNIMRNLNSASEFFDNGDAISLTEDKILQRGKISVIDVTGIKGTQFGAILLRDLLHRIVSAKSEKRSDVPVLIIIDEVHMFYGADSTREALGALDVICRTGRSSQIGIIFSSQSPTDIPSGHSSVINAKVFFKTDASAARQLGFNVNQQELESLKKGYALASIHELSQVKTIKFPLAFAGDITKGGKNE